MIVSHHFGLGNLSLESLVSPKSQNKTTGQESSAKFHTALLAKQKRLEEQLIENRVRKLELDEARLRKQIEIANKHSATVDHVIERKMKDLMDKHDRIAKKDAQVESLRQANQASRFSTLKRIEDAKKNLESMNTTSRMLQK